jgi:maleylacetate reductase
VSHCPSFEAFEEGQYQQGMARLDHHRILTMQPFIYEQPAVRILFGAGTLARLYEEIKRLDVNRPFFIATPGRRRDAEQAANSLSEITAGIYSDAVMHVPIETITRARDAALKHKADSIVAFGGGSAIDTSKAVGLELNLPILAVPTTYGGSEVTPFYGYTEDGIKKGKRDRNMLPKTVVYDPALTLSLPANTSAASGMNAIAHCVEGLYGKTANPVMSLLAAEGIRRLSHSLPLVVADPSNIDARTEAFYGAWLAGVVLGSVGMAVHHNISHVLGGTFKLTHADVHAVILPHAVAFNRDAAPDAMRIIAEALGAGDAAQGLYDLERRTGSPTSLKQIGMPYDQLDRAAKLVVEHAYYNPRPVEFEGIRRLLENAYSGNLL